MVVSKDLPMRVKAASVGVAAEEYRAELAVDSGWTGIAEIDLSTSRWATSRDDVISTRLLRDLPVHMGAGDPVGSRGRRSAGSRDKGELKVVRGDRDVFGLHGRSAEQRLAIDLLLDPEIGIVSLGGRAGTGKCALALCAGLEAVLEKRQHRKIMVFRPLYAVGGQELGYLPGDQDEKMNPWGQAVFDTLGALVSENVIDEVVERGCSRCCP